MRGYRSIYAAGVGKVAEYQDDVLVWHNAEYFARKRSALAAPTIMKDIGEYTSPIDGARISSRSAHRDHLRQHEVIELGNEPLREYNEAPLDSSRDIGEQIKRRIDEVVAMPQREYDAHIETLQSEQTATAAMAVAS